MISQPVRHLELSTRKGTKNVRETSDMVVGELSTEDTERTENFQCRLCVLLTKKTTKDTEGHGVFVIK